MHAQLYIYTYTQRLQDFDLFNHCRTPALAARSKVKRALRGSNQRTENQSRTRFFPPEQVRVPLPRGGEQVKESPEPRGRRGGAGGEGRCEVIGEQHNWEKHHEPGVKP